MARRHPDKPAAKPLGRGVRSAAVSPPEKRRFLPPWLISISLLAVLTLGMFADVLFTPLHPVISNRETDIFLEYLDWLTFGFGELRRGNLALWNPHLFGGTPFFGGFQSALLYPLNALFLVLPVDRAINWTIALHVFLAGAFTYAWVARRALRPGACFLAAVIYMFCGANFLHVYGGHFPILCTLAWAPLVFLAIDGTLDAPSLGWSLLGMFAVAMEVLAGGPQYVFYTGVAAAVLCGLCLPAAPHWRRAVLGLAGIVLGGIGLSAVQVLTSVPEWGEMVRDGGAPFEVAASYSFPPENFLTLLAPGLFGDMKTLPYWGRWTLWEMCLFISVTGLVLVACGVIWGERRMRRSSFIMVALLLLLALGVHTPLFKLLYQWVPGFNRFRGSSKFIFVASLFLAMLAAIGFDALARGRRPGRGYVGIVAGAGLVLLAVAVVMYPAGLDSPAVAWWRSIVQAIRNTGEIFLLPERLYDDPAFVVQAGRVAAQSVFVGGATLCVVAIVLVVIRKNPATVWLLVAMAVVELGVFARTSLDHFDLAEAADPKMKQFLEAHPGDYRILNLATRPDAALSLGANEIWGYNPGVLKRYSQLIGFTQGIDPDQATEFIRFTRDHPVLEMLRCRFQFVPDGNQVTVRESPNVLPHLLLIGRYRLLRGREEILSAVTDASFDPRREIVLETPPVPEPVPATDSGKVTLVESSSDELTVEADVPSPAILLVTDNYAKGWRARALPGSAQAAYRVMPADYSLRAVPLTAGHHLFRLEYIPVGFHMGKWISLVSLGGFLGLLGMCVSGQIRAEGKTPAAA